MNFNQILIVSVILKLTSGLQLPNLRLVKNCRSTYNIQRPGEKAVRIEVRNDTDACERISKLSQREDVQTVSDLSPSMAQGSYGNRKVVNINWTATVIGNKLPRMFLLELTKFVKQNGEFRDSKACVLLRVRNRKVGRQESPPVLYFNCVELVPEKEAYLGVQVWCLPGSESVKRSCRTRSKRSLPTSRNCRRFQGKVICSEDKLFPLSLDSHKPAICHCSPIPKLSLSRLENGSFHLETWDLPQYTYAVRMYVYRLNKEVYSISMDGTTRVNESRSVITNKSFGAGNYSLVVDAACPGEVEDIRRAGKICPQMDAVQLDYPLEVPHPPSTEPNVFKPAIHTLIPILGAVILSCLVTITIFCIRKWRYKTRSVSDPPTELQPLQPTNNVSNDESVLRGHAKLKPEKMFIYHSDNEFHQNCVEDLMRLATTFGLTLVKDSSNSKRGVSEIFDANTNDGGTGLDSNWRDFAELAGTDYTEIVIVISSGLLQLCKLFQNKSSDKEQLEAFKRERNYELIPCVVLQKLQTLIQDNPNTTSFSVHFVSFDPDSHLTEEFLNTFNFLRRCSNCYSYCLSINFKNDANGDTSLELNKTDLKLLLWRLKGLSEDDVEFHNINTEISDETFGTELGHALYQRLNSK